MTIDSTHGVDKISLSRSADGSCIRVTGDGFTIHVTPEDFASEAAPLDIPGLTVTYEKPAPPLPVDPGWYAARDDIDSGGNYGIILLGKDGEWQSRASAEHWHHNRGGLVPMIPAKDADL